MPTEYKPEDVEAFIATIASLEDKVKELEGGLHDVKVAELTQQVAELQSALDVKQAEIEVAKAAAIEIQAAWDAEKTEAVEAAARVERLAARTNAVKELALFDDAYIAAKAETWASLDDALFDATLADLREVASRRPAAPTAEIPATTALSTSRETAAGVASTADRLRSVVVGLYGINPKNLR